MTSNEVVLRVPVQLATTEILKTLHGAWWNIAEVPLPKTQKEIKWVPSGELISGPDGKVAEIYDLELSS